MKSMICEKLKSRSGASLILALLVFLVSAMVGSVILTAATGANGAASRQREYDQSMYQLTSGAQLLTQYFTAYSQDNPIELKEDYTFASKFYNESTIDDSTPDDSTKKEEKKFDQIPADLANSVYAYENDPTSGQKPPFGTANDMPLKLSAVPNNNKNDNGVRALQASIQIDEDYDVTINVKFAKPKETDAITDLTVNITSGKIYGGEDGELSGIFWDDAQYVTRRSDEK